MIQSGATSLWCWAIGVTVCLAPVSVADGPPRVREMGQVIQTSPPARIAVGMTRQAVEKLLKEEPVWTTGWPWCGGQYRALYLQSGLAVYYAADDTVIRTAPPWSELPAWGMILGEADDW